MEEVETPIPAPEAGTTPVTGPDTLAPPTPAVARTQRLAAALRDNLRRRKAAGKPTPPARTRN